VPLVENAVSAACGAEGLARETRRPDRPVLRPTGEVERVLPAADAGEEVAASVSHNIAWLDRADVAVIDDGLRPERAKPLSGVGLVFVQP
jgi:hypothetical protein